MTNIRRVRVNVRWFAILLTAAVATVLLVWRLAEPPRIKVLPGNWELKSKEDLLDRWIPNSWTWAYRLKATLFGGLSWATIEPRVLDVPFDNLVKRLPKPDLARTNGVRVWVLDASDFATFTNRSLVAFDKRKFFGPYQSEFGGKAGTVIETQSVGADTLFIANVIPVRRLGMTELTARLYWSTNSPLVARMIIPDGGGVLIVEERRPNERKVMTISARWR